MMFDLCKIFNLSKVQLFLDFSKCDLSKIFIFPKWKNILNDVWFKQDFQFMQGKVVFWFNQVRFKQDFLFHKMEGQTKQCLIQARFSI